MCAVCVLVAGGLMPAQAGQGEKTAPAPNFTVSGYVVPSYQIDVSPAVGGRLVEVNFEEGKVVKAGDVLARIERTEYLLEVDLAQARLKAAKARLAELQAGSRKEEIEQARARLTEARAVLAYSEQVHKRLQTLPQAVPQSQLDEARAKVLQARAHVQQVSRALAALERGPRQERLDAAAAEVQQAEARLGLARYRLDQTVLRAPRGGTILTKRADVGTFVQPSALNVPGSICVLADLSALEVEVAIPERDLGRVARGQRCVIRADAYPGAVYQGRVARIAPVADRARASISLRVSLASPGAGTTVLRPEMRVLVEFLAPAK
jgi:multidrug resistance efflux pump